MQMNKRKKKYVILYISLLVAFILQTTFLQGISIFGVAPSLILVLVICFSNSNDIVPSAVFSAVAGLLLDISSGRIIGFNAMLMMYLSLGIVYIGSEFFRDTPRATVMLVAIGTFIYELVFFIFNFVIFGNSHFFYMIYRVIFVEIIYNSIIAIPVNMYVQKFLKIRSGHSLLD